MKDKKNINSTCVCKYRLNSVNCEIIMIDPCEHLIHVECLKNQKRCPYCNVTITQIVKINDYKTNPKLKQKCIDILSVSSVDNLSQMSSLEIFSNTPQIVYIMTKLHLGYNCKQLCHDIFSLAGLTIKVNGLDKIKNNDKKVFIANHVGYLDALVLYYILECGFLASESIISDPFLKHIVKSIPLILVKRGTKQNTVNKMKEFISKHGSLCLFPEGMFSYPNTMSRFRSGAFRLNVPVYPIVLRYKNNILDTNMINFALKLGSNLNETIEITFIDPFYPPFNDETPELVRETMAKENVLLSRVFGNDYHD